MNRLLLLVVLAVFLAGSGCGQSQKAVVGPAASPSPAASGVAAGSMQPEQLFQAFDQMSQRESLADGLTWFRSVVGQDDGNAMAHILLASLLEQNGDFAEARREVDRGVQLAGGPNPVAFQVLGDLATDALEYDKALDYYKKMAESDPADARLRARSEWGAAYVYLWKDGPARAREALDRATSAEPENVGMQMLSCALLLCEGKADEAVKASRAVLASHADRIGPYFIVAQMLGSAGQPAEAARVLADGLKRFPDFPVMRTLQMRFQSLADPKAVDPAAAAALQMSAGAHPSLVTVWKSRFRSH